MPLGAGASGARLSTLKPAQAFFQCGENSSLTPLFWAPMSWSRATPPPLPWLPHGPRTHCALRGPAALSPVGGIDLQSHSHPDPPLLILVDARPLEPQEARGRSNRRRSFGFHRRAEPGAHLEANVEAPGCSASLRGWASTWGGARYPGGGAGDPPQGPQGPVSPGFEDRRGR